MVALTHNIKLAIYKDIHTERANTCVFEIEISLLFFSLLFFSLLFQENWVWVYILLGLFAYDGGLMAISNRERRWTNLVWGKVDQFEGFWVFGTDLGGSESHV